MGTESTGKVALVTGGSRGIGAAVAKQLAADGFDVVVTYQSSAKGAEEVASAIRALGRRAEAVAADATKPAEVGKVVRDVAAKYGRLDVLVNNAGVAEYAPIDQASDEHFAKQFTVNVESVFVAMREAAKLMQEGARIINMSSTLAERIPMANITVYAATKFAVDGLTKGAARDLGPKGITVNSVGPGPTHTDMNPSDGEGADSQRALTALGKYGSAEDVARAVSFLASPAAGHITGTTLFVDGGFAV